MAANDMRHVLKVIANHFYKNTIYFMFLTRFYKRINYFFFFLDHNL